MRPLILSFLLLAFASEAAAQSSVHAANGKALAERWCQSCHDIAGAGSSDAAPGFRTLAERPEVDDPRLAGFLSAPHPPMPDLALSNREIADLVAYIRSLNSN